MSEISLKELQDLKKQMEDEMLKAVQTFYEKTNVEVGFIFLEQTVNYAHPRRAKYSAVKTQIKI